MEGVEKVFISPKIYYREIELYALREREFIISDEVQTQNYKETSKTALAQKFTPEEVQT
jgi:hypothetical protein